MGTEIWQCCKQIWTHCFSYDVVSYYVQVSEYRPRWQFFKMDFRAYGKVGAYGRREIGAGATIA
jgi:hypothetical protein